ncbi:hypothetical protein [Paenibacillus glacialis]|uniref:Uncharacterized protein n=1 Tax=Paenibacillus glacialis TaxID=494026 RepID=A0A168H3D4_9BACL|nr:hypothetical protein [Paenibacillus glacialis]OAB37776.1 hypothetical protein PGLA_20605 [Paenibacillus glacialis]
MKKINVSQELLGEFDNIQWFINCGKVVNIELSCSVQHVQGWEEAEKYDEQEEWEELISNSRDILADFIMRKLGYSVRQFNSVVASIRDSVQYKLSVTKLYDIIEEQDIKEEFGATLSWLLLNAGIEATFKEFKGCPNFFREMLLIFQHGHCPCGWKGKWPKGMLYIY